MADPLWTATALSSSDFLRAVIPLGSRCDASVIMFWMEYDVPDGINVPAIHLKLAVQHHVKHELGDDVHVLVRGVHDHHGPLFTSTSLQVGVSGRAALISVALFGFFMSASER